LRRFDAIGSPRRAGGALLRNHDQVGHNVGPWIGHTRTAMRLALIASRRKTIRIT
jgi:hypothetical protein